MRKLNFLLLGLSFIFLFSFVSANYCTFSNWDWTEDCVSPPNREISTLPACIRDDYFYEVYPPAPPASPTGFVEVGVPGDGLYHNSAKFTSPSAVENFRTGYGLPEALTSDLVNPTQYQASTLTGSILTLQLNRDYSCTGKFEELGFPAETSCYDTYVLPYTYLKFAGITVAEFLAIANEALGGNKAALIPYGYSYFTLNSAASSLNSQFAACNTCNLIDANITGNCAGGISSACEAGETVTVSARFEGPCYPPKYIQVDASSIDSTCTIAKTGADIYGIKGVCDGPLCTYNWTIPSVPVDCIGKLVKATAGGMYTDSTLSTLVDSADHVDGNFTFYAPTYPPLIESIECSKDGTNFVACSQIVLNDSIQKVRARCTDPDNDVASVKLSLRNPASTLLINKETGNKSGDYYTYTPATPITVNPIGDWNVSAICVDSAVPAHEAYRQEIWNVSFPNHPPILESIVCSRDGTNFIPCNQIVYGDPITNLRAKCTDVDNDIVNVEFTLRDPSDVIKSRGNDSSGVSDWFEWDVNPDIPATTAGDWNASAICTDSLSNKAYKQERWNISTEFQNPPNIFINSPPPGDTTTSLSSYTVEWSAEDQDNDTLVFDLYWDLDTTENNGNETIILNGLWQSNCSVGERGSIDGVTCSYPFSLPDPPFSNGAFLYFYVTASDWLFSAEAYSGKLTIDRTPPAVNEAPSIIRVENNPTALVGSDLTVNVFWLEPNSDSGKMFICSTSAIDTTDKANPACVAEERCIDDTLRQGDPINEQTSSCTFNVETTAGNFTFYAFVCDNWLTIDERLCSNPSPMQFEVQEQGEPTGPIGTYGILQIVSFELKPSVARPDSRVQAILKVKNISETDQTGVIASFSHNTIDGFNHTFDGITILKGQIGTFSYAYELSGITDPATGNPLVQGDYWIDAEAHNANDNVSYRALLTIVQIEAISVSELSLYFIPILIVIVLLVIYWNRLPFAKK